jgi:Putative transposase
VPTWPDGHVARLWYNACRQRSGPQGADLQTERWLALQRARRLACEHSPGLCPRPHERNPRWLANVPVRSTLLLQVVRAPLGTLLADAQSLGAPPGILAAWHPWRQPLVRHPPRQCFVTGGGLPPEGHWQAVRNGLLLPARGGMAGWRGQRGAARRRACARDDLVLPEARRPQQFSQRLTRRGHPPKTRWKVRIMARDPHGAGVVTSLARSLRGGPIKNVRLVAWEGDRVPCT